MTTQAGHVRQIASAAGVVSLATLFSRLLGFVRDMAIAWLFGAGMLADAFSFPPSPGPRPGRAGTPRGTSPRP
ncbi:MAG: hypothetical protein HYS69_17105 [candidate division NC10 bacterium]|nr:hypothetical protein [candidate division NC10 bacterium]